MKVKKYLVFLLVLLLLLVSCGEMKSHEAKDETSTQVEETKETPGEAEAQKQESQVKEAKEELIYVVREINATLDPCKKLTDGYLRRVGAAEPMFLITPEGEVIPGFMKEAKQVDEHHWELHLRENGKFWSGKEIKAEEVLASLERTRTESADGESILQGLTFTKGSDDVVLVESEKANQDIPFTLSNVTMMNAEKDFTSVENTDLTGMYKILEFQPKQKLVLEINEHHWDTPPKIKRISYEEISDDDTRILTALNGRSDITTEITPVNATRFKDDKDVELYTVNPSGTLSVYLNTKNEFLADKRVRQALNWALDRDEIASIASEGFGISTSTWLGTNPLYYSEQKKVYDKEDLAKAEALLKEAGLIKNSQGILEKDGKPFTFVFYTWGSDKVLGELVQNAWRELGIDVQLSHVDYSIIEAARESGEWDGFIETWVNYGDMYSVLSKQFMPGGSINYVNYENPAVTELIKSLETENDPAKVKEIAKKVNEMTAEDAILVPLMPRPVTVAVNKKLQGYHPHFLFAMPVINNKMEFTE